MNISCYIFCSPPFLKKVTFHVKLCVRSIDIVSHILAFNRFFFIRSTMPPLMTIVLNVFPRYGWYSLLGYAYGRMMMNNGSKGNHVECGLPSVIPKWSLILFHSELTFQFQSWTNWPGGGGGGRFKKAYELLLLRYLKFSYANKINIFWYMGKIF